MSITLVSIVVFIIGLALWVLPTGAKANEVGRILMLAGALGFVLEGQHSISIR